MEFTKTRLDSKMSLELGFAVKARLAATGVSPVGLWCKGMETRSWKLGPEQRWR